MTSGVDPAPRLVLDTSAYSHFRAGDPRVAGDIAAAGIVLMPVTVLGELHGGFDLGSRARENRVTLAEFLAEPFVSVVPTTPSIARQYGRIFAALRRAGTPVPVNDLWIAAATVDQGARLLTFDRDFARINGLQCTILDEQTADSDDSER